MTNAERIRQMTDEEMADFLPSRAVCPPKVRNCPYGVSNCKICWYNWLKQEVSE